jgi:hypothetical protein
MTAKVYDVSAMSVPSLHNECITYTRLAMIMYARAPAADIMNALSRHTPITPYYLYVLLPPLSTFRPLRAVLLLTSSHVRTFQHITCPGSTVLHYYSLPRDT